MSPLGVLALSVLARVPLGDWDEALAAQERLLRLLPESQNEPPSFAMTRLASPVLDPGEVRIGGGSLAAGLVDRRLG